MTLTSSQVQQPLLCRLNLHHRWQMDHSPGRGLFHRCTRCGKDDRGAGTGQRPPLPDTMERQVW